MFQGQMGVLTIVIGYQYQSYEKRETTAWQHFYKKGFSYSYCIHIILYLKKLHENQFLIPSVAIFQHPVSSTCACTRTASSLPHRTVKHKTLLHKVKKIISLCSVLIQKRKIYCIVLYYQINGSKNLGFHPRHTLCTSVDILDIGCL